MRTKLFELSPAKNRKNVRFGLKTAKRQKMNQFKSYCSTASKRQYNRIRTCFVKYCPVCLLLLLLIYACTADRSRKGPKPTGLSGKELAEIHCAGCHLFPAPDLLDKSAWENGILPEMAYRLGMRDPLEKLAVLAPDEIITVLRAASYPDGPVLASEDWQKIIRFYVGNAPEKPLPQELKSPVGAGLPFFEVRPLAEKMDVLPMVSLVKIDETDGCIYAGRREKRMLEVYDRSLKKIESLPVSSPLSDMALSKGQGLMALQMGTMEPNDLCNGQLIAIDAQKQKVVLLDSLQRPVQMTVIDLNGDGIADYLVCQYGNETGKLCWYDGKNMQEHVLKIQAGARNTVVQDMNNDGRPDIVVLMCQAREGISVWYNLGKDVFEEHFILQFPPVYGSSYFTLADMNADGRPDILYTNGDNADYSYSLKRYHGLRIFMNEGNDRFAEKFFYPVYGASKVAAADFDSDGDLDLALIAFFPDEHQKPNEGFLFFENRGDLHFDVSTFKEAASGHWLVMDTGDVDGDGRPDIVLGSFFKSGLGQRTEKAESAGPVPMFFLRNVSKRKGR